MIIGGRIIGGLIGLIWGPVGSIIGFLLGYFFDRGLAKNLISPQQAGEIQAVFFQTTFLVMGFVAKSDGRVTEEEVLAARKVMVQLGLSPALKREAIDLFSQGKQPQFDLAASMQKLSAKAGFYKQLTIFFLEIQVRIACANGQPGAAKVEILTQIAQLLNLPSTLVAHLLRMQFASEYFSDQTQSKTYRHPDSGHAARLKAAYEVLGIDAQSSDPAIKKAYRKLMSQHHPDKLASRGLPESMRPMAKEKTQQIAAAYELICKERNLK